LAPAQVARLRQRAARVLTAAGCRGAELSILLTDDTEIRDLNRTWRQADRATDVLSFSQLEGPGRHGRADPHVLGDVVVSAETAARRRKRPLEDELVRLLVHGVCHLLGYDHPTRAAARRMFAHERTLIRRTTPRSG
jgi:probable rRNA maturation factor